MKPPKSRKNSDPDDLASRIKAEAIRLGFDACGIARAVPLKEDADRLEDWLSNHFQGDMQYMEKYFTARTNPTVLLPGTRSVISVLKNYYPAQRQQHVDAPVLSAYAYGRDYHPVIKKGLRQLLQFIGASAGPVNGRAFVDSAPVLDRAWAARSGLGWIGKNTHLISPAAGSYFFIGTLLVDTVLPYDHPIRDFCGDCNRCIRACPTQAIITDRVLDARKCISYLTIENKAEIPREFEGKMNNRVFGCDICQEVCPWNRKAVPNSEPDFVPRPGLLEMTRGDWYNLDEESYRRTFAGSAVKRAKFSGLRRNLRFLDSRHDEPASPPQ